MSSDRELLELAARAAGLAGDWSTTLGGWDCLVIAGNHPWQPLHDDGDALRLAVKLKMRIAIDSLPAGFVAVYTLDSMMLDTHEPIVHGDTAGATRRCITRAAAAMAPQEKAE